MMKSMNFFLFIAILVSAASALVCPSAPRHQVQATFSRDKVVMMPAILEKETVRPRGAAVLERPQVDRGEKADNSRKEKSHVGDEDWEVRIYNDGMNTREHVARSLVQVTGLSEMSAYQTMMRAHQNGIAAVGKWCFEVAEMYNEGLRGHGIISDIVPVDEES
jgi:ATP-dependent Clp protease adapter protein ClpS